MTKVPCDHLLQELEKARNKIDRIDRKLLTLLNQRLNAVQEIGETKKEMGKKIYDPKREKEVLKRLQIENRDPLKEKGLEKIFRTIMKVCREAQKP